MARLSQDPVLDPVLGPSLDHVLGPSLDHVLGPSLITLSLVHYTGPVLYLALAYPILYWPWSYPIYGTPPIHPGYTPPCTPAPASVQLLLHGSVRHGHGLRLEPFTRQPVSMDQKLDIMDPILDPVWTQFLNTGVLPYRRDSSLASFAQNCSLRYSRFRARK